jgi:DNA-binding MarR family transcriptional regulator
VERVANPVDGRSVLITLTPQGFATVDAAMIAYVATQARLTPL